MNKSLSNLPDVHFGKVKKTDWRKVDDGEEDDDEELAQSDPATMKILGFDPKDIKD
jgi:hypothetical protein